ncbi:hypothetical protein HMPREF0973_01484 [Prevotella veroralis F0319]|uniref:Uncharacterized protein n=1 Tax=Prevotella veroralis F0319 TaxID=649761 RepID=C9MPE3_9BACT|nr:hypothetical protein HMPREF0973_01484 [Prevotella veroralis F0319]
MTSSSSYYIRYLCIGQRLPLHLSHILFYNFCEFIEEIEIIVYLCTDYL